MQSDRIWDILQACPVGMFTTSFPGGLRARPLEARPDRKANAIFFVIDVRGLKDDEVKASPDACFTVVDADANAYLSVSGQATTFYDEALLGKIWKKSDDVWWPNGPLDKNVRILALRPSIADLWDGPASVVVASLEMAKARLTGEKPDLGENRKISVTMSAPRREQEA
jgi:general stress protein 26